MISQNASGMTMRFPGVTVNVKPRPKTPYSIMRVARVIDTGRGTQTVILENALPYEWEIDINKPASKQGLSLPRRMAGLNCIYTGRKFGVVIDLMDTLKALTQGATLATIVPDVIAPGDFLVFRHDGPRFRTRFAGAMRAIPARKSMQA